MDSTKLRIVLRTAYLFCFVIRHADGFSSSFFRTHFVSLRSNKVSWHRPTIPPLTPLRLGRSFIRQDASLLAFYSEKAALQYLLEC